MNEILIFSIGLWVGGISVYFMMKHKKLDNSSKGGDG